MLTRKEIFTFKRLFTAGQIITKRKGEITTNFLLGGIYVALFVGHCII